MSVVKYAAKFDELSRYGYALVDTDVRRNERFIRGLRPELGRMAMTHIREPYHVMVEIAFRHEEMLVVSVREKPVESQVRQGRKMKLFMKKHFGLNLIPKLKTVRELMDKVKQINTFQNLINQRQNWQQH